MSYILKDRRLINGEVRDGGAEKTNIDRRNVHGHMGESRGDRLRERDCVSLLHLIDMMNGQSILI